MAVINVSNGYVYSLMAKVIDTGVPFLETGNFYLALMGTGFTFNAAHTDWADVKANEIDDPGISGYTSGGKVVVFDGGGRFSYAAATGIWTFGPSCPALDWAGADFTTDPVKWGLLYEYVDDPLDPGTPDDTSVLVAAYQLTSNASPSAETFRWTFPATGLLRWLATIA